MKHHGTPDDIDDDQLQPGTSRGYAELLQELRVAQIGVQVLFAFLLGCAFTQRFGALSGYEHGLYVMTLLLTLASLSLLAAPVAYHRVLFRRGFKAQIISVSNRLAAVGLTILVFATSTAMLLVLDMTLGHGPATAITAACTAWYATWWYAVPMTKRIRHHARVAQLPAGHPESPRSGGAIV